MNVFFLPGFELMTWLVAWSMGFLNNYSLVLLTFNIKGNCRKSADANWKRAVANLVALLVNCLLKCLLHASSLRKVKVLESCEFHAMMGSFRVWHAHSSSKSKYRLQNLVTGFRETKLVRFGAFMRTQKQQIVVSNLPTIHASMRTRIRLPKLSSL